MPNRSPIALAVLGPSQSDSRMRSRTGSASARRMMPWQSAAATSVAATSVAATSVAASDAATSDAATSDAARAGERGVIEISVLATLDVINTLKRTIEAGPEGESCRPTSTDDGPGGGAGDA